VIADAFEFDNVIVTVLLVAVGTEDGVNDFAIVGGLSTTATPVPLSEKPVAPGAVVVTVNAWFAGPVTLGVNV
jgi:hypothetical protein